MNLFEDMPRFFSQPRPEPEAEDPSARALRDHVHSFNMIETNPGVPGLAPFRSWGRATINGRLYDFRFVGQQLLQEAEGSKPFVCDGMIEIRWIEGSAVVPDPTAPADADWSTVADRDSTTGSDVDPAESEFTYPTRNPNLARTAAQFASDALNCPDSD
ncbi:hypothetical protein BT63DRAFT_320071 [Microthyrium microscopicum]|uniref:Uncharacterized protein n=1 Tax=Microthyrium microscopicum TaxID=703497 RepID=A0A6A6U5H6_9PEZI|nr:hypothetical protein BT63DRAFT_320071 [Microthyrium microscopicum]